MQQLLPFLATGAVLWPALPREDKSVSQWPKGKDSEKTTTIKTKQVINPEFTGTPGRIVSVLHPFSDSFLGVLEGSL